MAMAAAMKESLLCNQIISIKKSADGGPSGVKMPKVSYSLGGYKRIHRSIVLAASASIGLAVEPITAVLDGKAIAQEIRNQVAVEVSRMRDAPGKVPGLAVVLVGARKDSETYVCSNKKACVEAGIASLGIDLTEDSSEEEIERAVRKSNDDPSVHGVLVQLPLPQHINKEKILNVINIEKDVDGFHLLNIGRLAMQGRRPLFIPCTLKGCIELLLRSGIDMMGKKAVVIGHSNIVGMPVAMILQRHNATVTIVHSYTKNSTDLTREAVVIDVGINAVVIDVGINAVENPNARRGYRLVGDVCYEEASRVASAITPVPGGVGPVMKDTSFIIFGNVNIWLALQN